MMALPGSAGVESRGGAGRSACGKAWQARQKPLWASGAGNSSPFVPRCTVRSPSGEQMTVAIPALAAWARHSAGAKTVCTSKRAAIRRAKKVAGRCTEGRLIRWAGAAKPGRIAATDANAGECVAWKRAAAPYSKPQPQRPSRQVHGLHPSQAYPLKAIFPPTMVWVTCVSRNSTPSRARISRSSRAISASLPNSSDPFSASSRCAQAPRRV